MFMRLKSEAPSITLELSIIAVFASWVIHLFPHLSFYHLTPFFVFPFRRLLDFSSIEGRTKYYLALPIFGLSFILILLPRNTPKRFQSSTLRENSKVLDHRAHKISKNIESMKSRAIVKKNIEEVPLHEKAPLDAIVSNQDTKPESDISYLDISEELAQKAEQEAEDEEQNNGEIKPKIRKPYQDRLSSQKVPPTIIPTPPPVYKDPEELKRRDAIRAYYEKNKPNKSN